ncbi:hypothetical protein KSP40_PGU001463 [Platanthera guangdongensis]|uniref:Uncharacterized protein n=1 Tax=Platanthera guangdongensis TaxID=2320717 RepID=A0ABR2N306_9ASPA
MAPKTTSGLLGGGELVWTVLASASDEFGNVILMLETVDLSFVLQHPCKILDKDILKSCQHAKLHREDSVIKSKVRSTKVKVKASILTRLTRFGIPDRCNIEDVTITTGDILTEVAENALATVDESSSEDMPSLPSVPITENPSASNKSDQNLYPRPITRNQDFVDYILYHSFNNFRCRIIFNLGIFILSTAQLISDGLVKQFRHLDSCVLSRLISRPYQIWIMRAIVNRNSKLACRTPMLAFHPDVVILSIAHHRQVPISSLTGFRFMKIPSAKENRSQRCLPHHSQLPDPRIPLRSCISTSRPRFSFMLHIAFLSRIIEEHPFVFGLDAKNINHRPPEESRTAEGKEKTAYWRRRRVAKRPLVHDEEEAAPIRGGRRRTGGQMAVRQEQGNTAPVGGGGTFLE